MAKQKIKETIVPKATDYLAQVDLDITDEDLTSKPLVKKFLQELTETKADNIAISESLEAAQNALEIKKQEYVELDKEHTVLQATSRSKKGLRTIGDLALVGLGAGLGYMPVSRLAGVACVAVSGVVFIVVKLYDR